MIRANVSRSSSSAGVGARTPAAIATRSRLALAAISSATELGIGDVDREGFDVSLIALDRGGDLARASALMSARTSRADPVLVGSAARRSRRRSPARPRQRLIPSVLSPPSRRSERRPCPPPPCSQRAPVAGPHRLGQGISVGSGELVAQLPDRSSREARRRSGPASPPGRPARAGPPAPPARSARRRSGRSG